MSWTATSVLMCWNSTAIESFRGASVTSEPGIQRDKWSTLCIPGPALTRRPGTTSSSPPPRKPRRSGAESLARLRVEIKHMPATIELELRAAGRPDRRQVIKHIARHAVGRDHVQKPVRDQQAERRAEGEQRAQIVFRARLQPTALPIPLAGGVAREQRI